MKDRIKQLMESQHLTQQSFAQMTGISPASLSSIFTDRTNPTLKHVMLIKDKIPNLNTDWLIYGTGPMYMDKDDNNETGNVQSANNEPLLDFDTSSKTSRPVQAPSLFSQNDEASVKEPPRSVQQTVVKIVDKPQRKVSQIQVIYDDDTIEIFVPKK